MLHLQSATDPLEFRLCVWAGQSVHAGGVSLLTDYMMIGRDEEGALRDVYVRLDADDGGGGGGDDADQ